MAHSSDILTLKLFRQLQTYFSQTWFFEFSLDPFYNKLILIYCSGVQTINNGQPDYEVPGQSSTGYCLVSPKSSFKSSTSVSTSSPELPASTSSISSTSCSSLIPTTMASPASPNHLENNQSIVRSNNLLGGILTLNDGINLRNGNNRDGTTSTSSTISISNNSNRRKRDGCGNRLDAMVRKLAHRQKEKEAAEAAAILASGSTDISMCLGTASTISSASSSSAASSVITTAIGLVVPPEQSSPPSKAIWHTQMIDPVAYVNMLRTMSGAAAAAAMAATAISSPSSIFPPINKTIQNDRLVKYFIKSLYCSVPVFVSFLFISGFSLFYLPIPVLWNIISVITIMIVIMIFRITADVIHFISWPPYHVLPVPFLFLCFSHDILWPYWPKP